MKKKELEQLKGKLPEDLKKDLSEYRDRLWTLKTDLAAGKVKNVKEIKKVKKMIARTLTFLNQHQSRLETVEPGSSRNNNKI